MNFGKLNPEEIKNFLQINNIQVGPNAPQIALQLYMNGASSNFANVQLTENLIALDRSARFPTLINGLISRAKILDMTEEQLQQWIQAFHLPNNNRLNLLKIAEFQNKVQDPDTYTITFGERVENHKGMEMIGALAESGISVAELNVAAQRLNSLGYKVELYDLRNLVSNIPNVNAEEAAILIVRNGATAVLNGYDVNNLYWEQKRLHYDTKAKMKGKVVNKKARHNICMADHSSTANYDEGKGTVIAFKDLPYLNLIRQNLPTYLGTEKARNLNAEGNHYYDVKTTYIDMHGDTERRIVIAIRLGASFPLAYQWHYKGEKIGQRAEFILNNGDLYIMSEKAVGTDWRRTVIPTLRHGAGDPVLLKKLDDAKKKK